MKVVEVRILRWMCDVTRMVRIVNKYIRKSLGVTSWEMREHRLRKFGHVKRKNNEDIAKKIDEIRVEGNQGRGRTKKVDGEIWEHINYRKIRLVIVKGEGKEYK